MRSLVALLMAVTLSGRTLLIASLVGVSSGCVSLGPSDWRPEQHAVVMRVCKVACHPGRMLRYDSTDGSCECRNKE